MIRKIEACGVELTRWSRDHFGNIIKELEKKKKRKELTQAERVAIQGGELGKVWQLQKEVNALTDKEE